MADHRSLTGNDLHEPKGVENALLGQVYVANGAGGGSWVDRFTGFLNLNRHFLSGRVDNVSEVTSFFRAAPFKATLSSFSGILSGTITAPNATVTIYRNGLAQTPTITIPANGSGAGVQTTLAISPAISVNTGDVLEVRSNGASEGAASLDVTLGLTAVV